MYWGQVTAFLVRPPLHGRSPSVEISSEQVEWEMGNITRSQGGEESSYTLIKTWEGSLDVLCRVPARQQCFHQRRRKMRWRRSCSERGISEWKRERERERRGREELYIESFNTRLQTQKSHCAVCLFLYNLPFHIFARLCVCVCGRCCCWKKPCINLILYISYTL